MLNNEGEIKKPDEKKSGRQLNKITVSLITVLTVSACIIIFYLCSIVSKRNEKDFLADMQEDVMQRKDEAPTAWTDNDMEDGGTGSEKETPAADTFQENITGNTMAEAQGKPEIIQLASGYIRSIRASSELTDTTKTYKAEALFDGDRETCWSEGADETGKGGTKI